MTQFRLISQASPPVIGCEMTFNNVKFFVMEDGEVYMSVGNIGSMINVLNDDYMDYMEWKKAHGTTK